MADADAALPTPPPEVVAPEEHAVGAESTVAAPAEVDNKRKLEEVSADAEVKGTSEDAKRPRVDGEPDAATGGSLGPPCPESVVHRAFTSRRSLLLIRLIGSLVFFDREQGLSSKSMGPP